MISAFLKRYPVILTISLLICLLLMGACGSKTAYEDYKDFENMSWNRFDDQHFEFRVEDPGNKYSLKIILVTDENIQHNTLLFDTHIITPGGEERGMSHKLHLNRQEPDTEKPAGGGNSYAVYLLKDHTFNEKGLVKVDVFNRMPVTQTSGIQKIGIRVLEK